MRTPAAWSRPVKAALVNWLPSMVRRPSIRSAERVRPAGREGVGVEDLGLSEARERLVERLEAEGDVQAVRQSPRQHGPARPVDDRDQVEKPARHRQVGDVGSPDLVGPVDHHVPQQVRVDLVPWRRLRGPRLRADRRDPHQAHQALHPLAVDRPTLGPQHRRHPARAQERMSEEQLVKPTHQRQVVVVGGPLRPVDPGACK